MKVKLIEVNQGDCTGCRLCEMACSFSHEQDCSSDKSRIRIVKDEEFGNHLVLLCTQCAEAYCVETCSTEALYRDDDIGAILVKDELCNGCGACIEACPLGVLFFDRGKYVVFKCDLCRGDPECVKVCSREVLTLKEVALS